MVAAKLAKMPHGTNQHAQICAPSQNEAAKTALAECSNIDECQTWADKAAALASYARQSKDESLMRYAVRIRDRAIRRTGELLKQIEPANGANQNIADGTGPIVLTRKDAATEAGLSERQAKTAVRVANIPTAQFEALVESDQPPSVTKLAELGTVPKGRTTALAVVKSAVGRFFSYTNLSTCPRMPQLMDAAR